MFFSFSQHLLKQRKGKESSPIYDKSVQEYIWKTRLKSKFWHGSPSIDEILQYNIPNDTPFFHQNKNKHTSGQHILNTHIHAIMNSPFLSKQD